MNSILLLLPAILVLAAIGVYGWRNASKTARRAEHKSATAVEAAKLAIVTATTHERPADLEQGRIRTFLMLDESSIMSMYGQTPQAAAEARLREVERGTSREGALGLRGSLVEAGGRRSGSETVRETFEAETNAARALDVVLRHLVARDELVQLDLTAGGTVSGSPQGYVKVKASYRIALRDNDIAVSGPGIAFTVPLSRVPASASAVFVDGSTITAICFGRAVRRESSTVVVLPTALYLA